MVEFFIMLSLFILGILFAIVASMVGIGGGLLNVPALIFLYHVDPNQATLISSFVIIFTSTSGFLRHRQQKRIDYKTVLFYLALALPGIYVGIRIGEVIDTNLLKRLFAILIGVSAVRGILKAYRTRNDDMYKPIPSSEDTTTEEEIKERSQDLSYRRIVDVQGDIYEYKMNLGLGMLFAFIGGLLAGLLGVGGGIIFVPVLTVIANVPIHVAVATSTTLIMVVSFTTVVLRFYRANSAGQLDLVYILSYGLPLAFGSIIGAYFGASRMKKINSKHLIILFWIVALLAAIRMWLG